MAFFQIPACTKGAGARSGENDRVGFAGVHGQRFKNIHQIQSHLRVERIGKIRAVQSDLHDMVRRSGD